MDSILIYIFVSFLSWLLLSTDPFT